MKINRRHFIKGIAATATGLIVSRQLLHRRRSLARLFGGDQGAVDQAIRDHKLGQTSDAEAQAIVAAYMMGSPGKPRVVHIHHAQATNWDFGTHYYGDYVDQSAVNTMVDQGVIALTGAPTAVEAWGTLLPNYESGEAVAIKVNLNNAGSCSDSDTTIDALIHPVNAIVQGLVQIGVAEEDVWVYDAVRRIPDRFVNGCLYPNVKFFGLCRLSPGWSSDDRNAVVRFSPPSGSAPPSMRIPDLLIDAGYLINIPIIKTHDCAGVSLGFKNHLGTVNAPGQLHDYMCLNGGRFRTDYSPYVEIYQNPHVGAKTILTIGDGLFGALQGQSAVPSPWKTFDNSAPNSLLFATDPVALDCVMYDFLAAETSITSDADAYLSAAANVGLGVFEHGDPWNSGYSQIDYVRVEISC